MQFFEGVALRGDGVSERGGNAASIHFIFLNF